MSRDESPVAATSGRSQLRRGAALIAHHVRGHPVSFATAVGGAAVFATCTVASSWAVRRVVDQVILPRFEAGPQTWATVGSAVGLVILIGLVRAAGVVVRRTFAGITQYRAERDVIGLLSDHIQAQPLAWLQRWPSGDLIARIGVDAEASVSVLAPLPFASSTILLVVLAAAWLLAADVLLGLMAIALFPILAVLNVIYQRVAARHFDEAQAHLGRLSSAVHESFEGVVVVKAFGAEARETDRLATIASHLRHARTNAALVRADFETLLDSAPTVANIALIIVGAYRVKAGAITIGELIGIVYLFTLLVFPLRLVGYALSELPHSLAGWGRVREMLDEPLEADPGDHVGPSDPGVGVELVGVSFGYSADRAVLGDIDLRVAVGRVVAVVGATGSGKSTLLGLIAGLRRPESGSIARSPRCALVFQEPYLLSGTVRDNIELGTERSDAEIERALRIASAEFVGRLPTGLDTVVGERGVTVSGGQRQRIALARALVRHPEVLLLDDTTSALDPATEAQILGHLRSELAGVTMIIVASRPSTIALADEVLFIDGGTIRARGTHGEVIAADPLYREIVEAYEHDRSASESPGDTSPEPTLRGNR